jgi:signal transduction histidine kinase
MRQSAKSIDANVMISKAVQNLKSKIRNRFGRRRGRLVRHYFLISVFLISGGLITSGLVEIYFSYQQSREQLAILQQEVANAAAFKIEQFIQDIEIALRTATRSHEIALKGITPEYKFELKRLLFMTRAITEAVAFDDQGTERVRLSRLSTVTGIRQDAAVSEALERAKQGKSYFGPVYFVRGSEPYMSIAVPMERFAGDMVGFLKAEVNLKYIGDVVSSIRVGKAGYAYILSRSGDIVAHPDISFVLQRRNVAHLDRVKSAFQPLSTTVKATAVVVQNLWGKKVFSSHAPISNLDWSVIIERPVEEIYEPLYASMLRTSSLLLVGLGMALLASLFVARRVVRPLRTLRQGVERIGSGNLDHHLNVKTGDEIEVLAEEFNKMTANLRNAYEGLEQKVAIRTQELAVANDRLKELDRLKSDFVANVSHELRTPLTAIKGAVDLILREVTGPLTEKQVHYLTRVKSNTQQLAGMINDVLDLAKIEEGKVEFQAAHVSLGGLVHEVVETLKPIAADKSIELDITALAPSLLVWADRDKVNQVLMNLIGNAIKFTPPHGRVMVASARGDTNWVRVSVSDNGPGIAASEREKIFEKFYQVRANGGPKSKGTGLGLAIAKTLVELHGGKIWAESETNRGSTFYFTLPAAESMQAKSPADADMKVG